ncbi:hypothetical protein [Pseudomonas salmasensis]|uniref:hypothetical protein n=1 Tax=Pseudomonas salmasensis TaxID=2745514 RepID=UPI0016471D25|nr:hypothetical protein [Pseudomonas salmasensis]QXH77255.1 hypothetical protein HU731_022905 [Pseudomonas salmasensis]
MKTWAYLYEVAAVHGLVVCEIVEVKNAERMPDENSLEVSLFLDAVQRGLSLPKPGEDPYAFIKRWVECPANVDKTWRCVDGVFMSAADFEKFKVQGPSAVRRNPIV